MNPVKNILGVTAVAVAFGCVTRGDLDEIKTNQREIISKVEQLQKAGAATRRPQPPAPREPDPAAVYSFDVGEAYTKGPDDAWVTIVEVSDFQCPFCSRVAPTLEQVQETYGDDVRVVWKHNPLTSMHPDAMPSALAAECAGEQSEDKFWEYHDKLFANQRALAGSDLEGYAKDVGLNMGRWKSCVDDGTYQTKISKDRRTARVLGASGTPSFFVNGRFFSGVRPFLMFKQIIDEELEKAKNSGIAKGDYYAEAVVSKGRKSM